MGGNENKTDNIPTSFLWLKFLVIKLSSFNNDNEFNYDNEKWPTSSELVEYNIQKKSLT